MQSQQSKSGFTLIELIMVIAILAIISTLAVNRFGNMQKTAARKVSIANQQSIGRAVETYVALNDGKLNRLDSLIDARTTTASAGFSYGTNSNESVGGVYRGPVDIGSLTRAVVEEQNAGISDGLAGVLCTYAVNATEAAALKTFGLEYVMRHNTFASGYPAVHYGNGADGAVPQAADGLDPELSACITEAVTNGMVFAAINGCVDFGRVIYQDCGQELLPTASWGQGYNKDDVAAEISATGGPLLAFGLGSSASIIGVAEGGLEVAPYSEVLPKNYYRQYIILIRLKRSGSSSASLTTAEFAGVLDPEGNTIRKARHLLK